MTALETFTTASKPPLTTGRRPDMTGICAFRPTTGVDVKGHADRDDEIVGELPLGAADSLASERPALVFRVSAGSGGSTKLLVVGRRRPVAGLTTA